MGVVKVNLGCGLVAPEGWINFDRSPNLLLDRCRPLKRLMFRTGLLGQAHMVSWPRNISIRDVRRGLPVADDAAEAVYSSHMLEHLYLDEAREVLLECHRVLVSGGLLRLALPDGLAFAEQLVRNREDPGAALDYIAALGAHPNSDPGMLRRLFSGPGHRWQPTRALLHELLRTAGFSEITDRQFREGQLPDLELIEHRPDGLFLEATKR